MASSDATTVSYALQKVGKAEIVLQSQKLQAVRHVYEGRDVFLWLPTGFGKSIIMHLLRSLAQAPPTKPLGGRSLGTRLL